MQKKASNWSNWRACIASLPHPLPALQTIWQSYSASNLSFNAYCDSPHYTKRNSLVVGLNQVISQLLNGHGSVSCDNVLSIVCDENGEVGLDDDNTLSSLDTVLAVESREMKVV